MPAAQVVQPHALPELEQGLHGGSCRWQRSYQFLSQIHRAATAAAPSRADIRIHDDVDRNARRAVLDIRPLSRNAREECSAPQPIDESRGDASGEVHPAGRDHRERQVPRLGAEDLAEEIQRPIGQAVGLVERVPDDHDRRRSSASISARTAGCSGRGAGRGEIPVGVEDPGPREQPLPGDPAELLRRGTRAAQLCCLPRGAKSAWPPSEGRTR